MKIVSFIILIKKYFKVFKNSAFNQQKPTSYNNWYIEYIIFNKKQQSK